MKGDKKMDSYKAIMIAGRFESATETEKAEAWRYLITTGLAWSIDDWFARQASKLSKED